MNALNERIKELRKASGLTQLQLAEKLSVTDKAVSKWEVGEANPDITLLPSIAKIFGVTLDYLLTGKIEEEKISLDDMDSDRREEYLAKKDDAENFKKYGYADKHVLLSEEAFRKLGMPSRAYKKENKIRSIIIENNSINIFSLLLDEFVAFINSGRVEKIEYFGFSAGFLVADIIDDFVKMAAKLGRIDVLDLIKFKWFVVGNVSNCNRTDILEPYCVSEETIDYIFTEKSIPTSVIDYLAEPAFLLKVSKTGDFGRTIIKGVGGAQINAVLSRLYKNNDAARIKKVVDAFYNNLRTDAMKYVNYDTNEDIRNGYRKVEKKYINGVCFSTREANSNSYCEYYAYVPVIDLALAQAKNDLNMEFVKLFNEYNRKVANTLNANISYLNDEEIRMLNIKADPKTSEEEKMLATYTKYGLLKFESLMHSELTVLDGNKDAKLFKEKLETIKTMYEKYIKDTPICFMELIEKLISQKNYRKLFEFATDYQLKQLIEAIVTGDNEKIKLSAKELFLPKNNFYKELNDLKNEEKTLEERYRPYRNMETELQRIKISIKEHIEKNLIVGDKTLKDMLNWQYSIVDYSDLENVEDFTAYCASIKKRSIDSKIKTLEEEIEKITSERRNKAELKRVAEEIPFEYLKEELALGNLDRVIIKLCIRLESILKYEYHYEGDLYEMVDKYVKKHYVIKKLHDCTDDEDNDYQRLRDEDEQFKKDNKLVEIKTEALHKLRMKRNSLVHADKNNVEMNASDIRLCIEIVEAM